MSDGHIRRVGIDGREVVRTKLLGAGGQLPSRSHPGDAGFDLYVSERTRVHRGTFTDVHCQVAVEFPEGIWGLIVGRSSTIRNRGLLVVPAVIDQGYRGELFTAIWDVGGKVEWIEEGERVAQIIPLPLLADSIRLEDVGLDGELNDHSRGQRGFGSSGE